MKSRWEEVVDTSIVPDDVAVDELNVLGGIQLNSEYVPFDYERQCDDLQTILRLQGTE